MRLPPLQNHNKMKRLRNHFSKFLLLATVLSVTSAMGQISANYLIPGPTVGCGSLAVDFQDISTGNPTGWFWDFGNGLTSTDQNPLMLFNVGMYDVKLIVTDSLVSDTIIYNNIIKVFANPEANFTTDLTSGCLPLEVSFEDLSLSSSPIVSWFWDFGDGGNNISSNPTYTFDEEGAYDISLLVMDSNQCSNLISYSNFIKTEDKPIIDFLATPEFSCYSSQQVYFQNNTQNSNLYNYEWDFGDGQISSFQNPSHLYSNQGVYNVKLKVFSSICIDSVLKSDFIIVDGLLDVDFTADDSVGCEGGFTVNFNDISSEYTTSWLWDFGDGNTSALKNPTHTYTNKGFYDVTLKVTNQGNCLEQMTKPQYIELKPVPDIQFQTIDSVGCQLPFIVQLQDSTENVNSWVWKMDGTTLGNTQQLQYSVSNSGSFNIELEVEGVNGCKNSLVKNQYINIDPIQLSFTSNIQNGCAPLNVEFISQPISLSNIVEYVWDFGNGSQSYSQTPIEQYQNEGIFDISLLVENELGCTAKLVKNSFIKTTKPANTHFVASSSVICGNDSVIFSDLSTSTQPINSWYWDFDEGPYLNSTLQNPIHVFSDTGYHQVSLITEVNGCLDTLSIDSFIYVAAPIALFYPTQNCENYNQIQFHNESIDFDSCVWDFGDGNFSSTTHPNHVYSSYGVYDIKLQVFNTNANCTGKLLKKIAVEPAYPNLVVDSNFSTSGCPPLTVLFHDASPYSDANLNSPFNVADKILFGDGNYSNNNYQNTYENPGYYNVQHIVGNPLGCLDTLTYDSLIHVYDAQANFSVGNIVGCNPFQLELIDNSFSDDSIVSWNWKSNGQFSTLQTPIFSYINEGDYSAVLKIITMDGCEDSLMLQSLVQHTPVKGIVDYTETACFSDTITLASNSSGENISLEWGFSLSDSSIVQVHLNSTGVWKSNLIVTDINQCVDTALIEIEIMKPEANFSIDQVSTNCPPLLCGFEDLSSSSVTDWKWIFSDSSVYDLQNPSKLFSSSGSYDVQLIVTDSLGCLDTLNINDAIQIDGPSGNFVLSDDEVCSLEPITFIPNTNNTSALFWDFGDGSFSNIDTVQHDYSQIGVYYPQLILINNYGCQEIIVQDSIVVLNNTVFIDEVGDFSICPGDSVNVDIQTNGILDSWYPTIGLSDSLSLFTTITSDTSTLYIVSIKDGSCVNRDSIYVTVHQPLELPEYSFENSLCVGEEIIFQEEVDIPGGYAFSWEIQGYNYNYNPAIVFDYFGDFPIKLSVISDSTSCYTEMNDTITINQPPIIQAGENIVVCEGDSFTLTAEGAFGYLWEGQSVGQSINALAESTQIYEVEGVDGNGCKGKDDVMVIVQPLPEINVLGDTTLCKGDSLHLSSLDNYNYSWLGQTQVSSNFSSLPLSSHLLKVSRTSASSGCYAERLIEIVVNDTNQASIVSQNVICEGFEAILELDVEGPKVFSFNWSVNNQEFSTNTVATKFELKGSYHVQLVLENIHACQSRIYLEDVIMVQAIPDASFYQKNIELTEFENMATFIPKNQFYNSYDWDFGDGVYSTDITPNHEYLEPGKYEATLIVEENGCIDLDTISVLVEEEYTFWIPNAFTPNGDGLDEIFVPKGFGVEAFNMIVYTRWGEEIFFTKDLDSGWDGRLKGAERAPTGIYTYMIVTEDSNGKARTYQGEINLML